MNAVTVIGSTVLFGFGAWLLYGARDLVRLGFASYKWQKTEGTIIDSHDDSFTLTGIDRNYGISAVKYKETVHDYVYEVAGQMYKGNTYCFGGWAETSGAAYLIGTRVPVYYDPKQPERAVLRPGLQLGAIFGLVPIAAALIWIFFSRWDWQSHMG